MSPNHPNDPSVECQCSRLPTPPQLIFRIVYTPRPVAEIEELPEGALLPDCMF